MPKLFMCLIGCTPEGRRIEQHDIFFGIAEQIRDLVPAIKSFWPEAKGKLHLDAWREVTCVNGNLIKATLRARNESPHKLFFLNLGGYKENEFEEFHYRMLVVASNKAGAISQARQTAFYRHTGFTKAPSHIDDKYGIDLDDVYEIGDILPAEMKQQFSVAVEPMLTELREDELHIGYFKLDLL